MRAAALLAAALLFACGGGSSGTGSGNVTPDAGTPDAGMPDAGEPDAGTAPDAGTPDAGPPPQNPIGVENQLQGTAGWEISGDHQATYDQLEGYADAVSVQHGESVGLHLRTDGTRPVRWELLRLGWYGGAGARHIAEGGPLQVGPQPTPAPDSKTGLLECHWPTTFTLQTDAAWPSGVYLVKLTRDDGLQRYVPIVVRADERKGVAVVQAAVATWQAYNDWGGESLYVDRLGLSDGHAKEVSYDRPYQQGLGAGDLLTYESHFIRWFESLGMDAVYATNLDIAQRDVLRGQKLYMSVGHDEYWSRSQREAVKAAIDAGVNVAFFSGNTAYWQIRFEPSRSGTASRTQVCYKNSADSEDPLRATNLITDRWRDLSPGEPEQALLGVMYQSWQALDVPYIVRNSGHWLYAGTGLQDGDSLPFVVGNESDAFFSDAVSPAGVTLLANSPVIDRFGHPTSHNSSHYVAASGAFVVAIGAIEWSWGLGNPGKTDLRVQRITRNVLERAGLVATLPGDSLGAAVYAPDHTGAAASVGTIAGAAFQEGLVDGTAARFRRPTGIAADGAGRIYVADTGNHAVRLVANDATHTVSTLVGNGSAGLADGPGGRARLSSPMAIAVGGDGALYVSDGDNHRVVRIDGSAPWTTSTWAGSSQGQAGLAGGSRTDARFRYPMGIVAVGSDLYVVDSGNNRVCRIDSSGWVTTVADGLDYPTAITSDGSALYVVETQNHSVRRIALGSSGGNVIAGGSWDGGFLDGTALTARFLPFAGLAVTGSAGRVADTGNSVIRRIANGAVTTWAGSGQSGAVDGAAAGARFSLPTGLAPLPDGSIAVVDEGASTLRFIRP